MKKLRTKAMTLLGSVSLFLAFPTVAQQPPTAEKADGAATAGLCIFKDDKDSASVAFSSCEALRKTVVFEDYKNLGALAKKYPEIADILKRYGPGAENGVIEPVGRFAVLNNEMYLFRFEDRLFCGSLGCMNLGFTATQDGFIPTLSNTTGDPIYYAVEKGQLSVFFCGFENEMIHWTRADDSYEFTPVTLPQGYKRVPCPD